MPPADSDDGSSSAGEIPYTKQAKNKNKTAAKDEIEEAEDMEEDEYVVETVQSHKFEADGTLLLLVKWQGYGDEENTWEPEENLEGCPEELGVYFKEIGGRPSFKTKSTGSRGGGRASATPRGGKGAAAAAADDDEEDNEDEDDSASPAPGGKRGGGAKAGKNKRKNPGDVSALDDGAGEAAPKAKRGRKSKAELLALAEATAGRSASSTPARSQPRGGKSGGRSGPGRNSTGAGGSAAAAVNGKWTAPVGPWEEEVSEIITIQRDEKGMLCGIVRWMNGKQSMHQTQVLNARCPQKMLEFYESHLQFNPPPPQQQQRRHVLSPGPAHGQTPGSRSEETTKSTATTSGGAAGAGAGAGFGGAGTETGSGEDNQASDTAGPMDADTDVDMGMHVKGVAI